MVEPDLMDEQEAQSHWDIFRRKAVEMINRTYKWFK